MLRLLIADDEETIRGGLRRLIQSYQMDLTVIAEAEDGEEALEMVERYNPELILMDINMPFCSGLEVIRQIREVDGEAEIIIISGYDDFSYAQRAMELGVFRYLLKPIDYRGFREVLEKAADAYQRRIWERSQLKSAEPEAESCRDAVLAALGYVKEHFADNDLALGQVADRFHISQSHLTRLMKQRTGLTFTDYVNSLRIAMAQRLLENGERAYSIGEIADRVGYSSQHYFSRAFKNHTGVSPNKYRSQNVEKEG